MKQEISKLLQKCIENVTARVAALSVSRHPGLDEISIERAVFGLFFSGVKLSTGHGGLCFTPVKEMPEAVCCPSSAKAMPYAGKLAGRTAREYLEDVYDSNPLKRALGIATLNALSTYVLDIEGKLPPAAIGAEQNGFTMEIGDAFDFLEITPDTRAVVIGALVPMMKRLRAAGADWTVLEMDSRTLKGDELDHFLPAEQYHEVVPGADLLVITGVTILNDSLYGILDAASPDTEILVTGPTVSMLPEPLFARGVTMTGGLLVTDADKTLDLISEGGSGYHIFGKCAERVTIRCKEAATYQ